MIRYLLCVLTVVSLVVPLTASEGDSPLAEGRLSLEDSRERIEQVVQELGYSLSQTRSSQTESWRVYGRVAADEPYFFVRIHEDKRGRLIAISGRFRMVKMPTGEELRYHMTRSELEEHLGSPSETREFGDATWLAYPKLALYVTVNLEQKLEGFRISRTPP